LLTLNHPKFFAQFKNQRKGGAMKTIIKAKFLNGVIKPLKQLDIEEGKEITITIKEAPSKAIETIDSLKNSFGGWKGLIDAERLKRNIFEDRLIGTRPEPKL